MHIVYMVYDRHGTCIIVLGMVLSKNKVLDMVDIE